MVSASLHVKRGQIQSQLRREFEEPFSQFIMHHMILCVQLGLFTHQPPNERVQTTWGIQEIFYTLSNIHSV